MVDIAAWLIFVFEAVVRIRARGGRAYLAFLGTIAATLASLFVGAEEAQPDSELMLLRGEVAELRRSIGALTARLDR